MSRLFLLAGLPTSWIHFECSGCTEVPPPQPASFNTLTEDTSTPPLDLSLLRATSTFSNHQLHSMHQLLWLFASSGMDPKFQPYIFFPLVFIFTNVHLLAPGQFYRPRITHCLWGEVPRRTPGYLPIVLILLAAATRSNCWTNLTMVSNKSEVHVAPKVTVILS